MAVGAEPGTLASLNSDAEGLLGLCNRFGPRRRQLYPGHPHHTSKVALLTRHEHMWEYQQKRQSDDGGEALRTPFLRLLGPKTIVYMAS